MTPQTGSSAGAAVLLFNIAPRISSMLFQALHLAHFVPVEAFEQNEALLWLRTHPAPLAVILDMDTEADPCFLAQMQASASLLTMGIAGRVRSAVWREWVEITLPRPFRVYEILAILQRQQTILGTTDHW